MVLEKRRDFIPDISALNNRLTSFNVSAFDLSDPMRGGRRYVETVLSLMSDDELGAISSYLRIGQQEQVAFSGLCIEERRKRLALRGIPPEKINDLLK